MASTGAQAWEKHFKGKGVLDTVMKKDSTVYDKNGKVSGSIKAGAPIKVLVSDTYLEKYPIQYNNTDGFVTFNNIQKPRSSRVSGIKLKPQDFKCIMNTADFTAKQLAEDLASEIEDRTDLDPKLKTYLVALTRYYGKLGSVTKTDVDELYSSTLPGLAETQKDYGEMLGAIACVKYDLLKPSGFNLTSNDKLIFPVRGNEPIVDYYIKSGNKMISISAKSGSTTNTLKANDILSLLKSTGKEQKWKNKPIYKFIQLVGEKTTVELPFYGVNIIHPGLLTQKALDEVKAKFKTANFSSKTYNAYLFADLMKLLGYDATKPPSMGELFYYTEKYVIKAMNASYPATELFTDATSGMVIYVKFEISNSNKHGKFEVLSSDAQNVKKKDVIWRSKNATNRAADKIGLQP
jgi:hypothetical protein